MDTFDDPLLVTAAGYQELEREYLELTANGRRRLSERVRDARLDGGIAENPALFELLEEQLQLESRIASLSGDSAARRRYETKILAVEKTEGARKLPEYEKHQDDITSAITTARRSSGGKG